MKKGFNQLVYKSKHGDIPVEIRDNVPLNEVWIRNKDGSGKSLNIETLEVKEI